MKTRLSTKGAIVHFLLASVLLPVSVVSALELEDSENFEVVNVWSGTEVGVPGLLGAMMFSDDGDTLYVVGDSEQSNSALYAVQVTRDSETGEVTDLGPAEMTTLVFSGSLTGLDTGLEIGPDGTLFYTYWDANRIGERPGGFEGEETVYEMFTPGVPSSVAGLTFSPHVDDSNTGFGQMQVSSWFGDGIYNIPLTPLGDGLFEPGDAVLFVTLPQQGTGAIQYVPSGLFEGNVMYVNWDFGEVRVLEIDPETGLPIDADSGEPTLGTANPVDQRFAYELGVGPWGLEFDARSNDFFVSTWEGDPFNSIIQFSGPGFSNGTGGTGGGGGTGGDGGAGGTGGTPSDDGGGGCSCRVQEPQDGAGAALLAGIVTLFLSWRRRRKA
jgi:MYXO-CTERM domain-containing protein